MDLKKLNEALDEFAMFEDDGPLDWHEKPVVEAARAYRDLANGEWVEWCEVHGCKVSGHPVACVYAVAIGIAEVADCRMVPKLLIDPPTEED